MVRPEKVARRGVAAAIFVAFIALTGPASAEPVAFDVPEQTSIILNGRGPFVVKTWERSTVSVDGAEVPPVINRAARRFCGPGTIETPCRIEVPAATVKTEDDAAQLPYEEFVLTPGVRETVRVDVPAGPLVPGVQPEPVTVMIPSTTPILFGSAAAGMTLDDYHGTMVLQTRAGPMRLRNVSGDAFIQNLRGVTLVQDSTFQRVRARSALKNIVFQRCRAKQIEASSVHGSLLYDQGSFDQGLARFETQTGHVAIGVAGGGAQIGVRGMPGRVFGNFEGRAQFEEHNGEAFASVNGGGPLVNVVTRDGAVFLYDGALENRRRLPEGWRILRTAIGRVPQGPTASPPRPQAAPARPPERPPESVAPPRVTQPRGRLRLR